MRLARKIQRRPRVEALRMYRNYVASIYLAQRAAEARRQADFADQNPGVYKDKLPRPVINRRARRSLAKHHRGVRALCYAAPRFRTLADLDAVVAQLASAECTAEANLLLAKPLLESR